jgi:HD-GYP domain-containing protein (c-di-GMP phosphodiesterase class II)/ABC-type amino acid transport substrate-binding protein
MPEPGVSLQRRKFRLTIRITVVTIFIIATVVTAALAVSLQYYFTRRMAAEAAVNRFNGMAESTRQYLDAVDEKAVDTTRVLASYPGLVNNQWVNPEARDLFATMMRDATMLYAIYIGFGNGDFYEVINLDSGQAVKRQLHAEPSDRWVVVTVRGKGELRTRSYEYYSADFELRDRRSESSNYNATSRPWFVQAKGGEVNKTSPYLFANLKAPGQTYSSRTRSGAVIAVDIALSSMSDYLSTRESGQFGNVFLYRGTGELIASNQTQRENLVIPAAQPLSLSNAERAVVASRRVLKVSNEVDWAPIDFSISGHPRGYSIDYLSLISQMTGLRFEYINGFSWKDLVGLYKSGDIDILQPVFNNGDNAYPGSFSDAFLQLPYSLVTRSGHREISHIRQMRGVTIAVPEGWTIIDVLRKHYPAITVKIVASSRAVFEAVENGQADAGLDVSEILHYTGDKYFFKGLEYHDNIDFAPVNFPTRLHLVLPKEHADLLPIINRAIAGISNAQKTALARKWFHGPSQYQGMLTVPYSQLLELVHQPQQQRRLILERIDGQASYIFVTPFGNEGDSGDYLGIVIPVTTVLKPALEKVRFSVLLTVGFLLLLIPAPWIFASPVVSPIKRLAGENEKIRRRQYDQLDIPDSYIKEIDDLGHSMSSMVAAIRQHEANQIALMDSFIQLIAQAIDDKSRYTAGHCERVPELAFMLATKAGTSQSPPFRDFTFASEEEWREFRVGAWLHDCGKITTPEHIVDKGTKLETIYNRIHEVRTRFEVLWRDADIRYWQQLAEDPAGESRYQQVQDAAHRQLQEDFAFVASMNVGGECLSDEKKQRLRDIARGTWVRHFSDRLGLSPLEELRLSGEESPLPCEEPLLVDKPEHIIPREHDTSYDPRLGIQMDIPKDLYNQGELYNLCIERGTLTAEDRFKINEHIISTIRMLDAMPFPPELEQVPRYASTHHETMKGTGYPRRLTGDQLSVPERIMVLADIFEALTAADRPYKKAKPVSVAIDILARMVADEHMDVEVFELFLTSGVYREYAERYLPPEQMDEVDISRYLRA